MEEIYGDTWTRRGFTMLWEISALKKIATANSVMTIRELFEISQNWPEELPCANGNALVVVGLEPMLEVLNNDDAETWVENDLKNVILDFQSEYEGGAALIFWIPSGIQRFRIDTPTEEWHWFDFQSQEKISLGKSLWGGVQNELRFIVASSSEAQPLSKKPQPIGLYLSRIS